MKILCLILACLFIQQSAKAESLQFAASINNEELAEEAIDLLRCVSERKNVTWEFSVEITGTHWLKVREENNSIRGIYHAASNEIPFVMKVGGAGGICEKIAGEEIKLAPASEPSAAFPETSFAEKKTYWPWGLGIGLAVVAGFLIIKNSGPDHRAVLMN
jgi:hypothetical protein